jgi:hypothetical protein
MRICLGPWDPVDIAGPRLLSDAVVRRLNFTVRPPRARLSSSLIVWTLDKARHRFTVQSTL